MTAFGPIEGTSKEEVLDTLNTLYTPRGYKITKWGEKYKGFLRTKKIYSAEGYLVVEEKSAFQKSKEELLHAIPAQKNRSEKEILDGMKDMRERLGERLDQIERRLNQSESTQWDANVLEIRSLLEKNDFIPEYIDEICTRIHESMPQSEVKRLNSLKERVVDWIAADIKIESSVFKTAKQPMKILIFLGPTGVGKTTTIVKMAASLAGDAKYTFFTTDNYKIGAVDQMRKFAELLNISCSVIRKDEDMKLKFWEASAFELDLIFIDTPGFSPTHYTLAADVRQILEPCKAEAYPMLLIPAYTRYSDMIRIIEEFSIFDYKGIVFTKFDETTTVGTVISVMKKTGKPALFFTDGQDAAKNIEAATKTFLLNRLIGFGKAGQFK